MVSFKKFIPFLIVAIAFGFGGYFIAKGIFQNDQAASIKDARPIAAGYFYIDINYGNGGCARGIYEDNGTPVAVYGGRWNGTECVLKANRPTKNTYGMIVGTSTGGTTPATAVSGSDFFTNPGTMGILQIKLVQASVMSDADITGTFSQKTFDAIKAFQTKNKITATGYIDSATLKLLNAITIPGTMTKLPTTSAATIGL